MCDCYTARCEQCFREIEMHLGGYRTARSEIAVYCEACAPYYGDHMVEWTHKEFGKEEKVIVVPLTVSALRNWHSNHPNYKDCKVTAAFGFIPDKEKDSWIWREKNV